MLDALGFAWHLKTITGPYFRSELDLVEGIAFLLAAAGLYRFDPRVRIFAIFLTAINLFGLLAALFITPGLVVLLWLSAWLFVLFWLLSSSVRGQFLAARIESKAA
jgi:hypothetical protein